MTDRDRGITLIELVVAMALFALVAVMGLQTLTGMMRVRDRLTHDAALGAELSVAVTLLRNDMGAVVPILFREPSGRWGSAYAAPDGAGELAISAAGQRELHGYESAGFQRIRWRYDRVNQALTRQVWPSLMPADPRLLAPEVTVLNDVIGFSVRSYQEGKGWQSGDGHTQSSYSSSLPIAAEVTILTKELGAITLVETLK